MCSNTRDAGWEKKVREITGGKGVPVVYDSIGKDTFEASLDCLAAARDDGELRQFLRPGRHRSRRGSWRPRARCIVTRPTLAHYTRTAQELQETADDLFAVIKSGAVKIAINQRLRVERRRQGAGSAGRQEGRPARRF